MSAGHPEGFAVRTITTGIRLESLTDLAPVEAAAGFLRRAREQIEASGFTVQSLRLATQPLAPLCAAAGLAGAAESLAALDRWLAGNGLMIALGSLLPDGVPADSFAAWAADLAAATQETYFSVAVSSVDGQVDDTAIRAAAAAIAAISRVGDNGEANFRFGAAAGVPPSTPFFPVAYHGGSPAFSIGLESAGLVREAWQGLAGTRRAAAELRSLLEKRLSPVADLGRRLGRQEGFRFAGIDLSPAPSLEATIAGPIEGLSGQPFGTPGTLTACAAITRALQTSSLPSCGYSGLMLPLLEDRVLAARAVEGGIDIQNLLLYSAVCSTGLDVIPLPGDSSPTALGGLILDVATLAARLGKPLAARLLPLPGRLAGDRVAFANPHLTESVVLPLG